MGGIELVFELVFGVIALFAGLVALFASLVTLFAGLAVQGADVLEAVLEGLVKLVALLCVERGLLELCGLLSEALSELFDLQLEEVGALFGVLGVALSQALKLVLGLLGLSQEGLCFIVEDLEVVEVGLELGVEVLELGVLEVKVVALLVEGLDLLVEVEVGVALVVEEAAQVVGGQLGV